ncbi:hypothetical protein FACS1894187_03200 [Synergistales bacterium]|nr:hypothetical protein FACS1894187_03200 [Synergistales bacterium]
MSLPFFTVVIPTRNRHETLPYALATCLKQVDFDDFEVLISDNSDMDNNLSYEAIKEHIGDRVRYVRPPEVLGVCEHWEWILDSVRGEWVIYIGDDDGLTRDALYEYYECIKATGAEAVTSNLMSYQWPGFEFPPKIVEKNNTGTFWRTVPKDGERYHVMNSEEVLKKVLDYEALVVMLPFVYRATVKTELIMSIKKKYGGYFDGVPQDLYASLLTAGVLKEYVLVDKALSIIGSSIKSGAHASHALGGEALASKEFFALKPKNATYSLKYNKLQWNAAAFRDAMETWAERTSRKLPVLGFCKALWRDCLNSGTGTKGANIKKLLLHAAKNHYLTPLLLAGIALAVKSLTKRSVAPDNSELVLQYSGEEWNFSDVDSFAQACYDFCFSEPV